MATRNFGPIAGAGVRIQEKAGAKQIVPGALGITAHTGHMQKGPVNKLFLALNRKQFKFKAGGLINESQLPDNALDFFNLSNGAGALWLQRITDGTEKKSQRLLKNRRTPRAASIQIDAGNGGRWAGQKRIIVDEYASITATTVTLTNVPSDLKIDELVGGLIAFSAVSGKSFKIISNTALGVLVVASDIDLVAEVAGSADTLLSVILTNGGNAIGILIKDGLLKPLEEWGLEVFFIENGISTSVKNFEDLSSDPAADNFFEKVINDDPDSDFTITATDLNVGSVDAALRPANVSGNSLTLTDTVLNAKIHDEVISAVNGATAAINSLTPGASVIEDEITLTVSTAGVRAAGLLTFGANPTNNDTIPLNGKTITFKTVVVDATAEVLIGGSAEATLDNFVAFVNALVDVLIKDLIFVEKASVSTVDVFAQTAGLAGNALTTAAGSGATPPTYGGTTLSSGLDQIWDLVSKNLPFVTGVTVTSGIAFVAPNVFSTGFTILDITKDSTKLFAVADTIKIFVCPLEVEALVGGRLIPNTSKPRIQFLITSNTANSITVAIGSKMLDDAAAGDLFRVQVVQELSGGFDGLSAVTDQDFIDGYNTGTSPLRGLRGKNLGFIKLATPGVTAPAVQKAGAAFGLSQNWGYRYEVPASFTDENATDEFLNDSLGKNDMAVVTWPSFAFVTNRVGKGLKLTSMTGSIQGIEARIANDFLGFHKAAAGEEAVLTNIIKLPDGFEDKVIDEEFTNPRGINIIKDVGNFLVWGDRTFSNDTEFKFKHHREQLSHYENIFLENFNFIIFAINDAISDGLVRASFVQFFEPELAKRALRGDKLLDDALILKIDDENNTDATRALGDKNAELSLRLADTTERFIITISKQGITEG